MLGSKAAIKTRRGMSAASTARPAHDDVGNSIDEQHRARARPDEKPGQTFLSGPFYSATAPSLPLDRAGRLRGHVINHAVDAFDLVDDAGRDGSDEFHVERVEIRRHAVGRGHRA